MLRVGRRAGQSTKALLSTTHRISRFSFVHERRITSASASIRVLASTPTRLARRLNTIIPSPSIDTPASELVTRYAGPEYPQAPVWSLADLERSPPRQKLLRRRLEAQGIDDLQFLRWRNALLSYEDFSTAIGYLSYALLPASSVFDRRESRNNNAQPWGSIASLNDESCVKIAQKTPFWIVERLLKLQFLSPKHISVAVDLVRQYPRNQNRDAFAHIILSCIVHHVHSILPKLLKALRGDHGVGSETFAVILRALLSGPRVPASSAALPDRSIRMQVSHSKYPKPGPQTFLITFATYNEMRLILRHMTAKNMKLDEATYIRLANARPALPSSLIRTLNVDGVVNSRHTERKLIALARSFANEGKSFETGCVVDRVRKYRSMHSAIIVPVSAAFDRRTSSDPTVSQLLEGSNVSSGTPSNRAVERETVTQLNAMFLHSFRKDCRSRDPARLPHAAISYFRRLQLHFKRSIGAREPPFTSTQLGSKSHGMMMAWNSFVSCLAAQKGFPADKLLRVIDAASKASPLTTPSLRLQVPTITACILGLVQRGEYHTALQVWTRFLAKDITSASTNEPLDWIAIAAGGRALSESGHLAEAFQLLNDAILRNQRMHQHVSQSDLHIIAGERSQSGDFNIHGQPKLGFMTEHFTSFADHRTTSTAESETLAQDNGTLHSAVPASAGPPTPSTTTKEVQGVLHFVTSFMRTLAYRGRPDVVYALWDSMEALYGVRPNNHTLNTLLVTASSFSRPSKAVSLSQQMGWRRRVSRHREPGGRPPDKIAEIMNMLRDPVPSAKDVGFWWDNKPAWQTARQIFREVILGNWPELALVQPPAVAHPEGFHPLIGFPRLRFSPPRLPVPSNPLTPQSSPSSTSLVRIPRVTVGKYYDIIPTQRSFDAYIRLLCEHGLETEIPEALLWQRELGILPSHRSLRLALVHFSAVGTSAPFDEAVLLEHGEADSPYGKLKAWIRDWIPKGCMPTQNEIEKERMLWRTGEEHRARGWLAKDRECRRAKWRRSRKDLRNKGPRYSWREQTRAALVEKHHADSAGTQASLHNAQVSMW